MTGASTTREEVERLASYADDAACLAMTKDHANMMASTAATLRALLDERDALERVRDEAISRMSESARKAGSWQGTAEGKDIVIRQIEAERDAARAECEAHKARADRYDTEAACASILRAEVERMREALKAADDVIEWSGADILAGRPYRVVLDKYRETRAALAGAPRHE